MLQATPETELLLFWKQSFDAALHPNLTSLVKAQEQKFARMRTNLMLRTTAGWLMARIPTKEQAHFANVVVRCACPTQSEVQRVRISVST